MQKNNAPRKSYEAPALKKQANLKEITLFTDFAPPG